MKGQLLIDELDMYTKHGISIIKGSYNNLVAFPTLKDPEKNDWPEEDGQEFDLSVVALDTSEISIEFGFRDDLGFGGLIALLSDMGYHNFRFPILGRLVELSQV